MCQRLIIDADYMRSISDAFVTFMLTLHGVIGVIKNDSVQWQKVIQTIDDE